MKARHLTAVAVLALAAFATPAFALDLPSYTIRSTQGNTALASAEAATNANLLSTKDGCVGQSLYAKSGWVAGQRVSIAQSPYERNPLLGENCQSGFSDAGVTANNSFGD